MKVKLNTILAGPTQNARPGQVIDVSDEQGADLVKGGFAVEVIGKKAAKSEGAPENAAGAAPEKATGKAQRRGAAPVPPAENLPRA